MSNLACKCSAKGLIQNTCKICDEKKGQECKHIKKLSDRQIKKKPKIKKKLFFAESATSADGPATSKVTVRECDTFRIWSAGGVDVIVEPGSALFNVEPNNIIASAGPPTVPPADPTRPAIYVDTTTGELFVWNPDSGSVDKWETSTSQGATGPDGPTGSQGADGATGPQGNSGTEGPQGPQGSGDTGPQGPQGNSGPQGPASGPTGPQGETGVIGPQGIPGIPGSPGGPPGSQGSTGAGGPTGPCCFDPDYVNLGNTAAEGATALSPIAPLCVGNNQIIHGTFIVDIVDSVEGTVTLRPGHSGNFVYILDIQKGGNFTPCVSIFFNIPFSVLPTVIVTPILLANSATTDDIVGVVDSKSSVSEVAIGVVERASVNPKDFGFSFLIIGCL